MGVTVDEEKYETFIHSFIKWLEAYGALVKAIGEIEQSSGKSFEELSREFTKAEIISRMIEKIPANLAGRFFALFLEITRLMGTDIRRLKPEEKIEVGSKLVDLSKELKELIFEEIPKHIHREEGRGG